MYAIVDILGQQFKVEEKSKYYVPKLKDDLDQEITFENVLLYGDDSGTKIGSPYVKGVKVQAKVLEHLQDDKVLVFKKKRRTGYQKMNGHRQQLTKIEITAIG
ncbi:MAG: 50S ribosomal protein L21 [Ignavibacteriaceae bacterium]